MTIRPARFHTRTVRPQPTTAQLQELPAPAPPRNAELAAALRGMFSGYLHNETNDTYQVFRLNVMPYSATENPHNPNQMNVSTTAIAHLDRGTGGAFTTQRFDARSFYLRPGFTLKGPNADSYLDVAEWKQGLVRAVLYSHAFGRVGTVELLKGPLPDLPA